MGKPMSKSDLISKLAEEHTDKLTRKDVKKVLESLATVGYKELKKSGDVPGPRLREVRGDQEARHQGAQGHQPVHEGADGLQGEAGSQGAEGPPGEGRQGRGRLSRRHVCGCRGAGQRPPAAVILCRSVRGRTAPPLPRLRRYISGPWMGSRRDTLGFVVRPRRWSSRFLRRTARCSRCRTRARPSGTSPTRPGSSRRSCSDGPPFDRVVPITSSTRTTRRSGRGIRAPRAAC